MRLNLSPTVERYELIPPQEEGGTGIAIWARPALSEVMEDAKVDLADYADASEAQTLIASVDGGDVTPELMRAQGRFGLRLAKAVAALTIEKWEGVEDADGSPAPVTADRVHAFLDIPVIYQQYGEIYLARWMVVQSEKKGSAPSPTGTSEGARPTAKPARASAKNARKKPSARKR